MLPPGHYVLVEKYKVARGEEHSMEVVRDDPLEEIEWKRHQERLKIVRASLEAREVGQEDNMSRGDYSEASEPSEPCDSDSEREEAPIKQECSARLVNPLETAMREQEAALKELEDYAAASPVAEPSEFDDCHGKQIDFPLVDLDFVVELVEGKAFRGQAFLVQYGASLAGRCPCGAASTLALLRNASEDEGCLVAGRSHQGSLSSLCQRCVQAKGEAVDAETLQLVGLLTEEERGAAVLLRLRGNDLEGRLRCYRIFRWMLSYQVDARVLTADEEPRFVLRDVRELQKLANALEKEAKGALVHAKKGVCVPHFSDPVDEALSCMLGTRTFMQTIQAQGFSSIHGMKKELLACFKERNSMHIMSGVDEALVGSTSHDRWAG
jgi:hypothetical protein